jgi:hypothetical protein
MNLNPEKEFWEVRLPYGAADNFQTTAANERRKSLRVKCSISVELHPEGRPVIWGHASDLSQGGCFVEMAIPLDAGTKFEIVLWLGISKLRLKGVAASSSPGFGVGVRFTNATRPDRELLEHHMHSPV